MGRGTMGGAELARGTNCKHGNVETIYDGRERDTQNEKHHSYDLRFKLRAVAVAKKSIITADE